MNKYLILLGFLTLLVGIALAQAPPDFDQGNNIELVFDQPDALDFDIVIFQDIVPVQITSVASPLMFSAPVSPMETTMVYTTRLSSDLTWNTWSRSNLSDTDNIRTGLATKENELHYEGLFRLDIGELTMIF